MFYYETEAIVLSSFPLAEADKVVTFLTPNYGVLRGVANGARNVKSRFSGTLEPFSSVNVTFSHRERELVRIEKAELKKSYFHLVSKPLLLPYFAFIADTLISFIPQGVNEETTYRMVKACLETASSLNLPNAQSVPNEMKLLTLYFGIWMLKLSGYLPNWKYCGGCKKRFDEDYHLRIFINNFNAFCASCRRAEKASTSLNKEHLEIFRLALKLDPQNFIKNIEGNFLKEASHLHGVIEHLLHSVKEGIE